MSDGEETAASLSKYKAETWLEHSTEDTAGSGIIFGTCKCLTLAPLAGDHLPGIQTREESVSRWQEVVLLKYFTVAPGALRIMDGA